MRSKIFFCTISSTSLLMTETATSKCSRISSPWRHRCDSWIRKSYFFFLRYSEWIGESYEVAQPETRRGANGSQLSSQNNVFFNIMKVISIRRLNNALSNLVLRYSRIGRTLLSFVRTFRNVFSGSDVGS